jgi:predicted nucleic acid-binding protein
MGLNLHQVPTGTRIFIDSNIFLYIFFRHPKWGKSCQQFIKRTEGTDIQGLVDEFVYNEVIHKLMVTALMNRFHCSPQQAIALIRDTPEILNDFPALWEAGDIIRAMNLKVISGPFFPESVTLMQEYHLLITDAVHIAAMNKEKITHIASNDKDFLRVAGLSVWKPQSDTTGNLIHDQ